jgi:hypothetical protein
MTTKKETVCPLCGAKFTLNSEHLTAYWAVSWCEMDSGNLCPACYESAKKLKCISKRPLSLCQCPFGADILKGSENFTKEQYEKFCADHTWKKWVEKNHPEWI